MKITKRKFTVLAAAVLAGFSGCDTGTGGDPGTFVAVTGITGVPTEWYTGAELDLGGAAVTPSHATNKTIVWSVSGDDNGSTSVTTDDLATGKFTPAAEGTLTLTATITDGAAVGSDYTEDFTITIIDAFLVTSNADTGEGTLRQAILDAEAANGGTIVILLKAPDNVITIDDTDTGESSAANALPSITKNLVIEGNGATLTQNGDNRLLTINDASAVVRISRLCFKEGNIFGSGGAILLTAGNLTLESCIFTKNIASYSTAVYGGAINVTAGNLAVLGCTFDQNTASANQSRGGAIRLASGSNGYLTGNIFFANSAKTSPTVWTTTTSPGTTSYGYNVTDCPEGFSDASYTGWMFATGDVTLTDISFDGAYRPASESNGLPVIPALPENFPTTYFDGTPRGTNSTPGAMPKQE
jgi:hypothetical protein